MEVLQPEPLPPLSNITPVDIKKERMNHFATSLGIDPRFVNGVSYLPKQHDQAEPELELFAESDLKSMPSPAIMLYQIKEPQVI